MYSRPLRNKGLAAAEQRAGDEVLLAAERATQGNLVVKALKERIALTPKTDKSVFVVTVLIENKVKEQLVFNDLNTATAACIKFTSKYGGANVFISARSVR